MKKQVQFLAVLSAATVMAAVTPEIFNTIPGLARTAFAASRAGWTEENGDLSYLDSDGYPLTDTWKKKDNDWYYLNEDGVIARSQMVDEYYVDENGKRIYNQWISEDNEDWDDDAADTNWYYFGSDGKYAASEWQTINGKSYYFNEDGHMQTGMLELDGFTYYLGGEGDGVMKTGWVELENEDEEIDAETIWHYFDSKGRMIVNQVDRKIGSHYYTFENGILKTGWYQLPAAPAAEENTETATDSNAEGAAEPAALSVGDFQYYEEDGKRAEGWYQIEGAPGISEEGEIFTFYFKKGSPYHASEGIQTFNISSKRYAFNTRGEMMTGLQVVTTESGSTANYYFGDDGVMKTGKQTIYDEDLDENQTWFFLTEGGNKGQGFHGVRDNHVYRQGLRLDAERDLRYAPVELDGVQYLVNPSGTIQKASSSSKSDAKPELGKGFKDYKDSNDKIWTVNTSGVIQQ
ncbi:MAG: cell wall-binding protein [Lachnospiraceae bacterium]|nr:cell wall-binding protein [Lachnospiraceae bacterium]